MNLKEALKATSNVIELKDGKKYLLVFHGDKFPLENLQRLSEHLKENGITGLCVALKDGDTVEVIETP